MNRKNLNLAIIASFTSLLSFISMLPVLFTTVADVLGDTPITYGIVISLSLLLSLFLSFMILDKSTSITYKLEGYIAFSAFHVIIINKIHEIMAETLTVNLYSFEALNTETMINVYLYVVIASLTMFAFHLVLDLSNSIGNHLLLSKVLTTKSAIIHKGEWLSSISPSWAMDKDKHLSEDKLLAIIKYIENRNFVDKKFVANHKQWLNILTMDRADIEKKFLNARRTPASEPIPLHPVWADFTLEDAVSDNEEITIKRSL